MYGPRIRRHPGAPPSHQQRSGIILRSALTAVGMVNYPTEWWHWSFGDQYWALVSGVDHAVYGPTHPDGI
ncbi:M15 family metallopeptidase [Streptomyces sp. NPDC058676]|uniref:M15 family metallopeptidase n=1 Tax=unclassified Streptomyces TaxID=2593676 RepID=UPI0036508D82